MMCITYSIPSCASHPDSWLFSCTTAIRKDVLAKCYGGDVSRKKKLLKKQAEGKKRMKSMGRVNVPQEAFMAMVSTGILLRFSVPTPQACLACQHCSAYLYANSC